MIKKKKILKKLVEFVLIKAETKNPIWAIELYITNFLTLRCLIAKKDPKKIESNPEKSSNCLISKNNATIEIHLKKR
jgi:hypothetical protein